MAQLITVALQNNYTSDMHEHIKLANNIFDPETGQSLTYQKLIKHPKYKEIWTKSALNKFWWLAQGIGNCICGTETIKYVAKSSIPVDQWRDIAYVM